MKKYKIMEKVTKKQVKEAILKEALALNRKKEIYEELKKMKDELKQINESHFGIFPGLGFNKDHLQKSKIGGFADSSDALKTVEDEKIDELGALENEIKEMEEIEKQQAEDPQNEIAALRAEIQQIKEILQMK